MAINKIYTPAEVLEVGWRMPFIIGGIFGFVSVWLRQWLQETPLFREMQARQALSKELPLKKVLRDHRSSVILTMLMTWLLSAAIVVMILLQKLYNIPAEVTLLANSLAILALSVGCVVFGALADRYGPGRVLVGGCIMLGLSSMVLYQQLAVSSEHINALYAFCGFFVGVIGVVPSTAVKAFPTVVRFSGLSFSYNVAYAVFGGLTPLFVSKMLATNKMAPAHYVLGMSLLGVLIGIYLWRRDHRPKPR
jgi:MFS family permease